MCGQRADTDGFEKGGSRWLAHGEPPEEGCGTAPQFLSAPHFPLCGCCGGPALDISDHWRGLEPTATGAPKIMVSKHVRMELFNLCPLSSPVTEYVEPPYTMLPSSLLSVEYLLTIIFAVH